MQRRSIFKACRLNPATNTEDLDIAAKHTGRQQRTKRQKKEIRRRQKRQRPPHSPPLQKTDSSATGAKR